MDQIFLNLIGKLKRNNPIIATIVAENFSLLEDEALFLRTVLAIPEVHKFPFNGQYKTLVQIGGIHSKVEEQLEITRWRILKYHTLGQDSVCDEIEKDLHGLQEKSLIFINDVSRVELSDCQGTESRKLMTLAHTLKNIEDHFVIMLYQNTSPSSKNRFLRDLEYISDAVFRVSTCKVGYFNSVWYKSVDQAKTLIPPSTETHYSTCKIGKSYWSSDLFCFHEDKKVPKDYDLNSMAHSSEDKDASLESDKSDPEDEDPHNRTEDYDREATLPYRRAQNPEETRIFYYPDKEDDIDEDDPDNDLNI